MAFSVLLTTPFVKLLRVKHSIPLQVDEVGMSSVFSLSQLKAGQKREPAFSISTRIEDDNWDVRHESLRLLTTPNIKRHPII